MQLTLLSHFLTPSLQTAIQTFIPPTLRTHQNDRRAALEVARSLKSQLYFIEVDFDDMPLTDSLDDVFTFMDESEAGAGGGFTELPTGVFTYLTKCYSPSCTGDGGCYAPRCPYKINVSLFFSSFGAEEEEGRGRGKEVASSFSSLSLFSN